jgi:hypothetical protein
MKRRRQSCGLHRHLSKCIAPAAHGREFSGTDRRAGGGDRCRKIINREESMRGPQKARVSLGLKYHHVDVFSSKPLSGNGVTVFQLRKALPTVVMQELTRPRPL